MTDHPEQPGPRQPVSRRRFLRRGAVAVAATAGATAGAALARPAQAAPGDPITVDGANVGLGTTKLSGSSLEVAAGNASSGVSGVANVAVAAKPAAGATSASGVAGMGAGPAGAGVVASNPTGAQMLLAPNTVAFPPASTSYKPGAVVNHDTFGPYICVGSSDAGQPLWVPLTTPQLFLLDQPFRVYASTKDADHGNAKIARNQVRKIDTLFNLTGAPSGVPLNAFGVLGTVQLESTETNTGYLAIASGDVPQPGGFSSIVWSAANFAGVTAFTSATSYGDGSPDQIGFLSVACYSANSLAKTHFYIDIVGYYAYEVLIGGAAAAAQPEPLRATLGATRPSARKG